MNFRRGNRTKEEFAAHIEKCSITENMLMEIYVDWLNKQSSKDKYTYSHNGIANDGSFIENDKHITADADFVLYKNGGRPRKIEIKHCGPERSKFHIKVRHMKRCIKEDYAIINWMGTDSDNPRFCILTPKILEEKLANGKEVNFWQQPCHRWNNSEVKWVAPLANDI